MVKQAVFLAKPAEERRVRLVILNNPWQCRVILAEAKIDQIIPSRASQIADDFGRAARTPNTRHSPELEQREARAHGRSINALMSVISGGQDEPGHEPREPPRARRRFEVDEAWATEE